MDRTHRKPRLVFFQYKYDKRLASFLLTHKQEHARCLAEFFDVTVVSEDCDYQQVCDKYQPDLTLFESGVPFPSCDRPKITNTRSHPRIPKLGFLHSDAFCEARAGFLSDMDHWGIGTFFAIATTAAEHMPAIADDLFIWPNFVDTAIYQDYGLFKSIPVLFTGNKNTLYPWRRKIMWVVSKHYPSLICPHPGYTPNDTLTQFTVGEPYARTLNASWFVPACGTVAKEIVRKHFEVPACKACLVTEYSPALEAAGFVDMKNCVFADEHDITDKLYYLFHNTTELNAIIEAGHSLVHSRHTLKQRDQIFQWYILNANLQSNQRIVQTSPFEPLAVIDRSAAATMWQAKSNGLHLQLLHDGDKQLWAGNYGPAEQAYLKCLNYYRWMPEPLMRLALCNLYKGDAKAALSWITKPIDFTLSEYKAIDPDPIEWAYLIISLLCTGRVGEALSRSADFSSLRHLELDRARWAAQVLGNGVCALPSPEQEGVSNRRSVHQLPSRSLEEWIGQLCLMLRACGQPSSADTIMNCRGRQHALLQEGQASAGDKTVPVQSAESHAIESSTAWRSGSRNNTTFQAFKKRLPYSKVTAKLRHSLRRLLHGLETRYGYFLPYRLSVSKNDELFYVIHALTREEDIKTALLIGATAKEYTTEAILAGAAENPNKPTVFCVGGLQHRATDSRVNGRRSKWYSLSVSSPESLREELDNTIDKIKKDNGIDGFDVVVVDGSELGHCWPASITLDNELRKARFIVLDGISCTYNHRHYDGLLTDSQYALVDHNPGLRDGYAIFEKRRSAEDSGRRPAGGVGSGRTAPAEQMSHPLGDVWSET